MNAFGTAPSRKVIQQLEDAGHEAVFVGGSIRDYLLGKEATDIDIATSASPDEVKKVFPHTIDVGIAHGTVLVMIDHEPIEVTTYRTESTYTDHRRPDEVIFVKSLKEDLQRRDFTINALALTLEGELVDPFGGKEDLERRVIRSVGKASDRFDEDALRMVRAVRFSSVLGFDIEKYTLKAISDYAKMIQHVSVERIKVEMDKLWMGINPEKALAYIAGTGLSKHLPKFANEVDRIASCTPFTTAAQGWAALMLCGRFTAGEIASAYKMSNREKVFLSAVQEAFDSRLAGRFTTDHYYRFAFEVLIAAEKIWQVFHPTEIRIPEREIAENQQELPIRSKDELEVDGRDLMSWTGQRGGRWVGEWMDKIEEAVLYRKCPNESEKIKGWFLNEYKREE